MNVIFLDGESKSGKTAVGRSMQRALEAHGESTRLLVVGNLFRHLTLLALAGKPDDESVADWLEPATRQALKSEALLQPVDDPAKLEQPDVEQYVSVVGQFDFVQEAVAAWRVAALRKAAADGVTALLYDGRNLRAKLQDSLAPERATVALDLTIYCRPDVAAKRYLADEGVESPTDDELSRATQVITERRQRDRQRQQAAYVEPTNPLRLVVGSHSVDKTLSAAFAPEVSDPPRPILFDNSEVPREDGLHTVTELAIKAMQRLER